MLQTVGLEAARAELGLFRWQPSIEQVLTQDDTIGSPVVAVVALLHQFRKEPLSISSRRTSGMPTMSRFAGPGVDAFVNDGVIAIALLGDVASHFLAPSWAAQHPARKGNRS